MLASVKSDIGRMREINEDSYAFHPPYLFAVADGMGGHAAGEVASGLAIRALLEKVEAGYGKIPLQNLMEDAISHANELIYQVSLSKPEYLGMGTTLTAVYVEADTVYWSHVGDSRLYLFQKDNMLQITSDHSLVWELFLNGNITRDEMQTHPQRNMLTRAVGTSSDIKIDSGVFQWKPGDHLLLCTDGLTNMLSEQDILQILAVNSVAVEGQKVVDNLIDKANEAGGMDNITAIWLQYGDV
ncbi:protein phosphatase [Propionispora hippei DSM 15287]|uniref:Protein phosphatase n=1 Tax=Propionispora hippei DSM 15287 TaxID=1123003 RepID=A0A1M6ASJ0_9FIRM|nr:protein phosphatase [Propionispora hippei DSM 15287]